VRFFFKVLGKIHTTIFFTGSKEQFAALEEDLADHDHHFPEDSKEDWDEELQNPVHVHWTSFDELPKLDEEPHIPMGVIPENSTPTSVPPKPQEVKSVKSIGLQTKRKNVELVSGKPNIGSEINEIITTHEEEDKDDVKKALVERISFFSEENFRDRHERIAQTKSDWAVLYCGASQQLNKHIQKECKSMGILYFSEYFESW
jgi:hypothetical protein